MEYCDDPPCNLSPTVYAGPDQEINIPAIATLDGTVTDDDLSAVITTWSQVSPTGTATFADPTAVDTTVSFSVAGTYVLRLTAEDGALPVVTISDDVTITVFEAGNLQVRVSANSDDAEEWDDGRVLLGSSDLEMVFENRGGNQQVGMLFSGVTIPQGSTILSAYLQFKADETHSDATSLTIQGEAADHAATFTIALGNVSSRPKTTAAVPWSPAAWTMGDEGPAQQTPDISTVIQEIVNRPGWSIFNSIAIIVTGTGKRVAKSHNADLLSAPLLHVTFE